MNISQNLKHVFSTFFLQLCASRKILSDWHLFDLKYHFERVSQIEAQKKAYARNTANLEHVLFMFQL